LYGQIGARTSPIYLKDVAASTTATGRGLLTFARDFVLANFEGAEIVYGDSVIGQTPLLLRNSKTNEIYIESINNLGNNYSNLQRDNCNDHKESCELNDIETWTEKGWTKIQRVIRHKLAPEKKLFRITTHTGSVVVTDDHSLLNPNGEKVSPKDIKIGDELLHSFPVINNNQEYTFYNGLKLNTEIAQFLGMFMGDGSLNKEIYSKYFISDEEFKCLFFNKDSNKKVPHCVINSSENIKKAFLNGFCKSNYYKNNNGISINQNDICMAMGIYTLYKSLGYNVFIDVNMDIYKFNLEELENKNFNKIKKIEEWDRVDEEYVYDLTTDNHHFHAGVGNLIVHNTDSIFIKFKLVDENGEKMTGLPALQKSIETGLEAEHLIQRYLKPPHVLEYEKTFWPFILFTKKRYVGNLYETDINEYTQKSMGIVLKRRDNAPIVKYPVTTSKFPSSFYFVIHSCTLSLWFSLSIII
jgi:hypothetical protein